MRPSVETFRTLRDAGAGAARAWRFEFDKGDGTKFVREVEARTADAAHGLILASMRPYFYGDWDAALALPGARFDRAEAWDAEKPIAATPYTWQDPALLPRARWIYGRQLLRGHLHETVAPGGVGKTSYRIGSALALVTGLPLLGQPVWGGPKRVWLWNLEDSQEQLARMIQAACKHHEIGPDDIGDRLYVDSGVNGAKLILASAGEGGATIDDNVSADLVAEMLTRRIDYLNVDPFVSSHRCDENDNGAMDTLAKEWARIAHQADAAVDLTIHTRKMAGQEVTAEAARGAKALSDAARSVMVLNQMTADEAEKLGVEHAHRRRYFRAYDDKPNRAPPAERSDWYRLASVELGNGGLEGGDSMGVVEAWKPVDPTEGLPADALARVVSLIGKGEWLSSPQADAWAGIAVAEALGLDVDDKAHRVRVAGILRRWIKEKVLVEVSRHDTKKGRERKYIKVAGHLGNAAPHPESGVGSGGESGVAGADEASPPPPPL